jgi:transposase
MGRLPVLRRFPDGQEQALQSLFTIFRGGRICEYWRMRDKKYPSDITREQFERIRPLLESVCKQTKPRTVDLCEVWCAVLYLLKSGCQWRMLPGEFPKWRAVYQAAEMLFDTLEKSDETVEMRAQVIDRWLSARPRRAKRRSFYRPRTVFLQPAKGR